MKIHLNTSSPFPPFFFLLLLITIPFPSSSSTTANWYASCGNTFNCGTLTAVDYPFWGGDRPKECGHPDLLLTCNNGSITTITILKVDYGVLQIDQPNKILTIKRNDLAIGDICPDEFIDTTFESSLFEHASTYINLTIQYGCPLLNIPAVSITIPGSCIVNGSTYINNRIVSGAQGSGTCQKSVVIPVQTGSFEGIGLLSNIGKFIEGGFEMRWKMNTTNCDECKSSGGRCGFDLKSYRFACTCLESKQPWQGYKKCSGSNRPQLHSLTATSSGSKRGTKTNLVLPIVGAVLAGIVFGWIVFFCRQRRKRLGLGSKQLSIDTKELPTTPLTKKESNTSPSIAFIKSIPSYHSTKSDFGSNTSYFGAKVFSYNELVEATENFAEARELGDGGFGAVYYGTLSDGCAVAVKRLYESNYKRVEQFMNEIEILTKLRHENLVTLFGCTSKQSRELLLVYEYIPNGTVADHLYGKLATSGLLSWSVRLNIAIETARALAYLHASDIIHRDVKTTNILLDNDFHVKVADFGLCRLFPINATHVSTAPQGTPGYVDPDYHQCYQLTEKSDVYSFGVVLIELISSLPAVDINRHRHDINLSNMAINKIQNHKLHELVDPSLQFEANSSIKRMITSVAELAFRCLQQEKDMRPSMQEVLDILIAQKVEVVTIVVDDGVRLLKDNNSPLSPDSVTAKWDSGSTTISCG